jgi:hypothetical protein
VFFSGGVYYPHAREGVCNLLSETDVRFRAFVLKIHRPAKINCTAASKRHNLGVASFSDNREFTASATIQYAEAGGRRNKCQ